MNSRKKKLFLNTSSSFIFQITTIICGFILPRLILETYGSEVNGLTNSITQFLNIISFLELGVGAVVQSSLYKPLADKDPDQISRIIVSGQKFFSKIAFILLIYVIGLMIIYPFIAKQDFHFSYTATLIVAISISSFAQYYFGIVNRLLLVADQKGYISYNAQTVTLILNTIACFILMRAGATIHIVKLTTSLIYVLRPIVLMLYVKRNYKINWRIQYKTEPIKQKWNGVAQHVAAVVLDGTDNVVLTLFAGLKEVSVYSTYNLVVGGVKQLLLSMTNGIQSLMGELWAKQELDSLRNFFSWVEWAIHTGTVLVFGITSILIVPFVQVYTVGISDINYIEPIFAVLLVAANAGHCLRLPYNIMILAGGHYKQTQNNYIIAAIINVVISVLAVRKWGLIGVAVGTVIAMYYQTIWMAIYDSKNLIKWPLSNFIKQIIVDIISIIIIHFATSFIIMGDISYLAWLILSVKVTLVGSCVILIINMFFYPSHIKELIRKLIKVV